VCLFAVLVGLLVSGSVGKVENTQLETAEKIRLEVKAEAEKAK
jgi:hypothetical protein